MPLTGGSGAGPGSVTKSSTTPGSCGSCGCGCGGTAVAREAGGAAAAGGAAMREAAGAAREVVERGGAVKARSTSLVGEKRFSGAAGCEGGG